MKKPKEKTVFSETLAKELIKSFGLSETTLKVWRTRGTIPTAYITGEVDLSNRLKDTDSEYQKFIAILSMKEIASTKFRCLGNKGGDITRSTDRMTEAERISFKTEVTEIRNLLRTAINNPFEGNFKKVLKDSRLHPTILVGSVLYSRIRQDVMLRKEEKEEIRLIFMKFYNSIRI